MKVRKATLADVPAIVDMGAKFNAQSQTPIPYDRGTAETFAAGLIESPNAVIYRSESGFIGGALAPSYCNAAWVMAVELFWWATDRQGLRLLEAFEAWAEENNAQEIRMTTLAAIEGPERILRRRGYAPSEISYQRVT